MNEQQNVNVCIVCKWYVCKGIKWMVKIQRLEREWAKKKRTVCENQLNAVDAVHWSTKCKRTRYQSVCSVICIPLQTNYEVSQKETKRKKEREREKRREKSSQRLRLKNRLNASFVPWIFVCLLANKHTYIRSHTHEHTSNVVHIGKSMWFIGTRRWSGGWMCVCVCGRTKEKNVCTRSENEWVQMCDERGEHSRFIIFRFH